MLCEVRIYLILCVNGVHINCTAFMVPRSTTLVLCNNLGWLRATLYRLDKIFGTQLANVCQSGSYMYLLLIGKIFISSNHLHIVDHALRDHRSLEHVTSVPNTMSDCTNELPI